MWGGRGAGGGRGGKGRWGDVGSSGVGWGGVWWRVSEEESAREFSITGIAELPARQRQQHDVGWLGGGECIKVGWGGG